ncbi:MAG: two component AraC family transcriptional regulator [Paenibacillaceae bacterium]|jgi:two-component system response regulator YesN|nr:two component AraC family transcriptional regulator [Paenibacillaceae bacterium]
MRKIVIVDDEPVIRKGLSVMVRQIIGPAADIRLAADGEEALALMMEDQPDYLFTDIRMPRMDGLELCRRLAAMDTVTQIVVVSGYGDFEYARQCVSYGVKEYLLKPVGRAELQKTIAKLEEAANEPAGFVSVAKLDAWVERLHDAVWNLEQEKLQSVLQEWEQEVLRHKMSRSQHKELLEEGYTLLIRRLHASSVNPAQSLLRLSEGTPAQLFGQFAEAVRGILQELRIKRKGKAKDPVEEAKAFMEENLAREISLEEVAELLGLNPSYFSQLFKQVTGETFVHYRISRRMEKAKKLLGQSQYRITDISFEVGYADHPHFTKTFKKYTGQSPSEYRSQLGIE